MSAQIATSHIESLKERSDLSGFRNPAKADRADPRAGRNRPKASDQRPAFIGIDPP